MKTYPLSDSDIAAMERKPWLGATELSKLLQVSVSTIKNLWASGKLTYSLSPNKQRTRKSNWAMVKDYQRRLALMKI
jgi:hypothetical protein